MTPDLGRITDQINTIWDTYGTWLVAGVAAATIALAILSLLTWWRSQDRARALSRITALIVLAWTSEGLWEVARGTLGLPIAFAVMTFFVYEAMMVTAAMHAEQHRVTYGTPGPAGRYVWVLAATTATVVGLNAADTVGLVLRASLPLAAVGLWWVIAMRTPRDTDTPDIVAAREEAAARRAATWTVTPSTVLVWMRLMRPGQQTMSQAERDRRIHSMVKTADRLAASEAGTRAARWHAAKLRRLARRATAEDVAVVRSQVERTTRIVDLVLPDTPTGHQADTRPDIQVDNEWTTRVAPGRTSPAGSGGHRQDMRPDSVLVPATVTGHPSTTGHAAANAVDMTTAGLSRRQQRVLSLLEETDPRMKQADIARKLRVSSKTVQRELAALRRRLGVKTDEELRSLVTGQADPDEVDSGVDMRPVNGVDIAAAVGVDTTGHDHGAGPDNRQDN